MDVTTPAPVAGAFPQSARDDLRTFLGDFVASLRQVEFPAGLSLQHDSRSWGNLSDYPTLQKLDGSGGSRGDLQAKFGCLLSEELDLLLAVSLFIVFGTFVDVLLAILQHAIDQSSQPMSHGGNSFGSTEPAAQSSILRTEVGLAS